MDPARIITSWLSAALLLLSSSALAENSTDFGDYVVHFNSLATDMLHPQIARQYHITRSQNRGMINITVLKKVLGSPGQPVHANVTASARNLAGQTRTIRMREIRDGRAIYYIGEFGVANEETLKFTVRARPQGTVDNLEVEFSQDFYTD
ncbi:MAG: DUF4426 domain-containing protein [Gammaproteobacteria bacterium]|jgi:hypothetical protein|nr:DUF4426 domain-containing protein [Gammaproteobacteria bacterium]